jgi:hypothetical protein
VFFEKAELNKYDWRFCTIGGFLNAAKINFTFYKIQGMFWMAERVSVSRELVLVHRECDLEREIAS